MDGMNSQSNTPGKPQRSSRDPLGPDSFAEGYEPNDTFADGAQMPFPDSRTEPVERPVDKPVGEPETALAPRANEVELQEEPREEAAPSAAAAEQKKKAGKKSERVSGSVAASTWVALILGAILLVLMLVFILQNQAQVDINLFAWSFQLPAGIAYLFSTIIGALIMALVGGWRMLELRRQVRKAKKK